MVLRLVGVVRNPGDVPDADELRQAAATLRRLAELPGGCRTTRWRTPKLRDRVVLAAEVLECQLAVSAALDKTGQILRRLTLNPATDYQPIGPATV